MKPLKCKICGHEWMPRYPRKPIVCARCKRADWQTKREPKAGK